jgi:hypothetical protein
VGEFNVSRIIPRNGRGTATVGFRVAEGIVAGTGANSLTGRGNVTVVTIGDRPVAPDRNIVSFDNGVRVGNLVNAAGFDVLVGSAGVNTWENAAVASLTQMALPMGGAATVRVTAGAVTGNTIIPAGMAGRVRVNAIARAPRAPAANRNINTAWEYRVVTAAQMTAGINFADNTGWATVPATTSLDDIRGRATTNATDSILLRVRADESRGRPASHIAVVAP